MQLEPAAASIADVLLVGPYPPPFGGPGVHMVYLRQALERRGAVCRVLSIWDGGPSDDPAVDRARSGFDFCRVLANHIRRGFHVHHFFNVESSRAIVLAGAAAACTRVLGGSYSIGFIGGPSQKFLDQTSVTWSPLLRFALRAAEFVICNNDHVAGALVQRGARRSGVFPIPSFHGAQVQERGQLDDATRAFVQGQEPVLSAIVHPRYETDWPDHEIELLIAALRGLGEHYPEGGCVVIGGGDRLNAYAEMVRAAGLDARFHFVGELDHKDCLAVIGESSLFVRAYMKDGTSSSVREALALGVPTIASRNAQHPEQVLEFEPRDPESLTETLLRALDDLPRLKEGISANRDGPPEGLDAEISLFPGSRRRAS